jgi:hypothetical protein
MCTVPLIWFIRKSQNDCYILVRVDITQLYEEFVLNALFLSIYLLVDKSLIRISETAFWLGALLTVLSSNEERLRQLTRSTRMYYASWKDGHDFCTSVTVAAGTLNVIASLNEQWIGQSQFYLPFTSPSLNWMMVGQLLQRLIFASQ